MHFPVPPEPLFLVKKTTTHVHHMSKVCVVIYGTPTNVRSGWSYLFLLEVTSHCYASYRRWQEFSRDCAMTVISAVAQVRKFDKEWCREGLSELDFNLPHAVFLPMR